MNGFIGHVPNLVEVQHQLVIGLKKQDTTNKKIDICGHNTKESINKDFKDKDDD